MRDSLEYEYKFFDDSFFAKKIIYFKKKCRTFVFKIKNNYKLWQIPNYFHLQKKM